MVKNKKIIKILNSFLLIVKRIIYKVMKRVHEINFTFFFCLRTIIFTSLGLKYAAIICLYYTHAKRKKKERKRKIKIRIRGQKMEDERER